MLSIPFFPMTFSENDRPNSDAHQVNPSENNEADPKDRPRYRVELSSQCHEALRHAANSQGKHMKVLAEEILQAHLVEQK